jgi:carbamoyl-phosphate synthase small subunit
VNLVSVKEPTPYKGLDPKGPKIAMIDFGFKMNILRELQKRSREVCVFPSRTKLEDIEAWQPDGVFLTNGPGDPAEVQTAPEVVKNLLGKYPIFGICMGHQILALALGYKTYPLKFGHRGSNHPIKDFALDKIYVTAQNHGYAVELDKSAIDKNGPDDLEITHINLNDQTVAGLRSKKLNCMSVQFHPESHPGPHDATILFDHFIKDMVGYDSI